MDTTRKDILVKGRFNAWDSKDWAFLTLSIVLLGSGLFFLTSPDLIDISYYPLIGAIPFALVVLIRILFLGNLHITRTTIVWKTLVGPQRTYAFSDLGSCDFDPKTDHPVLLITNKLGKKIRRFKENKPTEAAGAIVLFYRYKNILPELVFELWKPLSKGKRTYEGVTRIIRIDGDIQREESGFIVLYENKLLYIPTKSDKPLRPDIAGRLQKSGAMSTKVIYTPSPFVLTHTLIEALLEANLPLAIRNELIQQMVDENGGCILTEPARTGKTWQWFSEGVELKIQRP